MQIIKSFLMPSAEDVLKKAMLYTALAGILYAGSSFIAILLATRWTSDYEAGILGLGFAMSQQLYTLGHFNSGGFQASDVSEQYSFTEYIASRVITVAAMVLVAILWIKAGDYSSDKASLFLILLLQRASESFCSVFTYRYQQKGRFDVGGRIELIKNGLSLAVFIAVLYTTRHIFISAGLSAATHILLFFLLDSSVLSSFRDSKISYSAKRVGHLLLSCLPLALATFMLYLLNTVTRLSLEKIMGPETLAVFNALFMVTFIIPVAANFILVPFITPLGENFNRREYTKITRFLFIQIGIITAASAIGLAFAGFCGTDILSWLFKKPLTPYTGELLYLVGGGILLALYQLAQTIFTVMRRQFRSLAAILPAVVFIFCATVQMISAQGILGASKSFFYATAILCGSSYTLLAITFRSLPSVRRDAGGQAPCRRD